MDLLLFDWPYFGLALAAVMTAWLLVERREPNAPPRWRDSYWLMRLLWPMYLVHEFEEHAIDALGRHYALMPEMCKMFGFASVEGCPTDPGFIFAVNVVGCWSAFSLPFLVGSKRPLVAACAWGLPLVNGASHIVYSALRAAYNPGVVTAAVLFMPLGIWTILTLVRSRVIERRQVPRVLATGAAMHAVLLVSVLLREHGLPYALFLAFNGAVGIVPWILGRVPRAQPAPLPSHAGSS